MVLRWLRGIGSTTTTFTISDGAFCERYGRCVYIGHFARDNRAMAIISIMS